MTWDEHVSLATHKLEQGGIDDARTNAEYLASHILLMSGRSDWRKNRLVEVNDIQAKQYQNLIARRLSREPLQYILGEWEFFGLPLAVRPGVLIPRPETEILVEEAFREAAMMSSSITIIDAGTGSGAIALALASKLPLAKVMGLDVSEAALQVARENQKRLSFKNVSFQEGDMLSNNWFSAIEGRVDLLVSNPPYVSLEDFNTLEPELKLFEPREALTDNANGLTFYKALVSHAKRLLSHQGRLLVELGYNVCEDVVRVCEHEGLQVMRIVKDLAGIDRVLVAERRLD